MSIEQELDKSLDKSAARKRKKARYLVPTFEQGKIEVCHDTFCNVFGAGKKVVTTVRQSDENDFGQGNDNRQGSKSKYADSIKEQLKRFPRQASHYSPYDESAGKDRILPEDLSYSKCWKQWCRENDKEFAEQADRLKFWRSMDRKRFYQNCG